RLRLRQIAIGLIEGGLEWPRIDLEQQLPFPDKRAFLVVLPEQIARRLPPDLGVHHSVERADPFAVNRDILRLDLRHLDVNRRWGGRRGFLFAYRPADDDQQSDHDRRERRQDDELMPQQKSHLHLQEISGVGSGEWGVGYRK